MDWKLSNFDLFSLNMTIKDAWIYDTAPEVEKMQKALEQLGAIYPHLSGRYNEQRKSVVFTQPAPNQLKLITADLSSHTIDELINHHGLVWSLVKPYDIKGFKKGKVAPFSATLAKLKEGAILYVQCAHATMDGHSFMTLMQQWASLYQGMEVSPMTINQELLPNPQSITKDATLQRVQQLGWVKMGGRQLFKMLFNLRRNNKIKQTHIIEVPIDEIGRIKEESQAGTNAVLSALAMKHLAAHLPNTKQLKMIMVTDLRNRIDGVDDSFFGNFSQALPLGTNFDAKLDTAKLAAAIESQVQATLDSPALAEQLQLSISAGHYSLPYFFFDPSDMNCSKPGTIYINNQLRMMACLLDWGHGLPRYAFPNDLVDMVKFWQPVAEGPVQIIYGGLAAKIMSK